MTKKRLTVRGSRDILRYLRGRRGRSGGGAAACSGSEAKDEKGEQWKIKVWGRI